MDIIEIQFAKRTQSVGQRLGRGDNTAMTTSTHRLAAGYEAKAGPRAHSISKGLEFLTARDIADITGLHVAVIRRAIERGELRAHKLCSRIRVQPEDFEAWLNANLVKA